MSAQGAMIALAEALVPARGRVRFAEEWRADLLHAADEGVPGWTVLLGAFRVASTLRVRLLVQGVAAASRSSAWRAVVLVLDGIVVGALLAVTGIPSGLLLAATAATVGIDSGLRLARRRATRPVTAGPAPR